MRTKFLMTSVVLPKLSRQTADSLRSDLYNSSEVATPFKA